MAAAGGTTSAAASRGTPARATRATARRSGSAAAGGTPRRRGDADEAERLVADRLEAVELVRRDVHHVARTELVLRVAQRDARAAALDHDAVVVRVPLEPR